MATVTILGSKHWPALRASALLLLLAVGFVQAQPVRKPSAYDYGAGSPVDASANRAAPSELRSLASRADFDRLARVYAPHSDNAMPHVLFAIDRHTEPAKLFFINTPRYALHETFLRSKGLLRGDKASFNRNYRAANRRFILGTLSWQPILKGYSYEFWEGDQLTPELLQTTANALQSGFFDSARFKANSSAQETVALTAGMEAITHAQLLGAQTFLPLNQGQATGRLRIVTSIQEVSDLHPQDIVLLREVPISLPPVAGVVTERPSTMLSHVNLLARGWGIPNAYVQSASEQYAAFNGQWVHLTVGPSGFTLRSATAAEQHAAQSQPRGNATPHQRVLLRPDLDRSELVALADLRIVDRRRCGAKAANLGEIQAARLPDVIVPDGFCIPFSAYADFMRGNGLSERISRMKQLPGFATNTEVRKKALHALQAEIEQWPINPSWVRNWEQYWTTQLGSQGVFVRSSSSSEDLPNFTGAGLYTTIANVRNATDLAAAVRKVWASVYNFEAWEARQAAGIDEQHIVMSVFVQKAIDSSASGVLITCDPFDASRRHMTYIAAKRGIGIRVVEGTRIAEQILYSHRSKAVLRLNQSEDDIALQLDAQGGVREVATSTGLAVLHDSLVVQLAHVGALIKQRFQGKEQDIEWAIQDDQIIILQARPFVTPSH